ncbi:hypothetical protein I4U23_011966 [Adineta vaga]|nr:hypothetical protein I4U23_011966 [Adineta vaga]
MPKYSNLHRKKTKYRCGRLLLTNKGIIKTIDLKNGGGTRSCLLYHNQMTFKDIHQQLLKLYKLDNTQDQTFLYDFEQQQFNLFEYKTFREYLNRNVLQGNSISIYLCTHQSSNDNLPRIMTIENDLPSKNKDYSFEHSINDLMTNIRQLVSQDHSNQILIQLYENIFVIYGYVFGIIIPLQQSHQNTNNFRHLQLFSSVFNSFCLFYDNLQLLKQFNRLLPSIQSKFSSTFYELILSSIDKLNSIQTFILDLTNLSTICESINTISSIRNQFKDELNQQTLLPPKSHFDLKLFNSCRHSLVTSRHLLKLLEDLMT